MIAKNDSTGMTELQQRAFQVTIKGRSLPGDIIFPGLSFLNTARIIHLESGATPGPLAMLIKLLLYSACRLPPLPLENNESTCHRRNNPPPHSGEFQS